MQNLYEYTKLAIKTATDLVDTGYTGVSVHVTGKTEVLFDEATHYSSNIVVPDITVKIKSGDRQI